MVSLFRDQDTDSFGIEYIAQELLKKIKNKSITHDICRIQPDDSIMCGFYCVAFIEFILVGKSLLGYINLFSLYESKNKGKMI